jgi:hypothetical protein
MIMDGIGGMSPSGPNAEIGMVDNPRSTSYINHDEIEIQDKESNSYTKKPVGKSGNKNG